MGCNGPSKDGLSSLTWYKQIVGLEALVMAVLVGAAVTRDLLTRLKRPLRDLARFCATALSFTLFSASDVGLCTCLVEALLVRGEVQPGGAEVVTASDKARSAKEA